MHLGSIYLIVKDFEKSLDFYEKLLEIPVSRRNMDRFAQFIFEGHTLSLRNGFFDRDNPDKVIRKGVYESEFDDMVCKAVSPNTHKFVINLWVDDLEKEYDRISRLDISNQVTKVKYINAGQPYYYFQLKDPDDNIIEINGNYSMQIGMED